MSQQSSFAMVFPGQGSQTLGMLDDLAIAFPVVKDTIDKASQAIDVDLWRIVHDGPIDRLNQTAFTQPIMLAADIAIWRAWLHLNGAYPKVVAGHSLGEFAALVCAESMRFEDAVKLVHLRGRLMQQAVPAGEGAMGAVIGLDDEAVAKACQQAQSIGVVVPANYNTVGQVVISGQKIAVEAALEQAKSLGAKIAKLIPVSVPSHSPLMQPAVQAFHDALDQINIATPAVSVVHNVDAKEHSDPVAIRALLVEQLVKPVQWVKTVERLALNGMTHVFECGPGKVLTGLNKRIDKSMHYAVINSVDSLHKEVELCH